MNEILQDKLMGMFIMKDFMEHNQYLPLNPRRQAFENYQNSPDIQCRVNEVVGKILELVDEV